LDNWKTNSEGVATPCYLRMLIAVM